MLNGDSIPNQLINEKSPYLLQHAHNPVNWFPWGKEAFDKAKAEDKPVFLSIGYSTCHWCHVMAHESFEDAEVAQLLNRDFIAIKVDKEERPDVDAVYMRVCQALTGSGGWPLTILMTPEQRPFYAGTYFPKRSRYHMPGLLDLLAAITEQWQNNKAELLRSGDRITAAMQEQSGEKAEKLTKDIVDTALAQFSQSFDSRFGGFGSQPKFPTPHNLLFLLQYHRVENDTHALEMVEKTLGQMYRGGIFDHIGFGFSRYSTDAKWLIPHFEKMLYDNALLSIAYLEAYEITGSDFYKMVAVKIIHYVFREMVDGTGGFHCAQDADSDGEEGKYYALTPVEIVALLGKVDGNSFNAYFNITDKGNFEGKSIPNLIENEDYAAVNQRMEQLAERVYAYRLTRTTLHKDDKILTSWNALMIVALCKAHRILGDGAYLVAAEKAMRFILTVLTDGQGGLRVRYRDGEASGAGNLDDYSFVILALLNLYDSTFHADYLRQALALHQKMMTHFWDEENGGFYLIAGNAEQLISRPKESYDGAIPSGNSVAAYCLMKLSKLTGDSKLGETAYKQLQFMAGAAEQYPAGYSFALLALMLELYPARELVCVVKDEADLTRLKEVLYKHYLPNTAVLVKDTQNAEQIESAAPFTKEYNLKDDRSTYYVCENNACSPPIHDLAELEKRLL
jgi:uncharacterized protein YyaL (SSP411 family)